MIYVIVDDSGHTFIYFNKQMKGNKREIIQLGAPIFQPTKEDASGKLRFSGIPLDSLPSSDSSLQFEALTREVSWYNIGGLDQSFLDG